MKLNDIYNESLHAILIAATVSFIVTVSLIAVWFV